MGCRFGGMEYVLQRRELRLGTTFVCKDFDQAAAFTSQVARMAGEEDDHHSGILTEWGKGAAAWCTHKIQGPHQNDFNLASKTNQPYGI
jgi:4a-hydroxytetrahydrobiopterin dehydratase